MPVKARGQRCFATAFPVPAYDPHAVRDDGGGVDPARGLSGVIPADPHRLARDDHPYDRAPGIPGVAGHETPTAEPEAMRSH